MTRGHGRVYTLCVCRSAIVKIMDILATLAISLHIGYKQGHIVDVADPAHTVASSDSPITHAQRQNMAAAARPRWGVDGAARPRG